MKATKLSPRSSEADPHSPARHGASVDRYPCPPSPNRRHYFVAARAIAGERVNVTRLLHRCRYCTLVATGAAGARGWCLMEELFAAHSTWR